MNISHNFVVGPTHFQLLSSKKAALDAVRIGAVADDQKLDVTFTMPAKGKAKEFVRAIRKAKGKELDAATVRTVTHVTALVRKVLEVTTTKPVTDEAARDVIERSQWNCTKLRQALGKGLTREQFKPISQAVQQVRTAVRAARGYKFSNKEIIALQDATPAHRAKLLRALRKDGAQRVARSEADRMHGEQRARVSYKVVRDKWGIKLARFRDQNGNEFIDSDGSPLTLPNYYFGAIKGLHGLRSRAHAHTNFIVRDEGSVVSRTASSAFPARATMFEISRMMGFPVDSWVKQANDKSAVVYLSLGGDNGTKLRADADTMCKTVGIRTPKFFTINSDDTPADGDYKDGATMENALDLQDICAHGIAYAGVIPAANTSNSFAGGFQTFVATDTFNIDGVEVVIDVLSCSWGMAEDNTSPQDLERLQRIGVNAMLKHKIVTCATGDNGSKDSTDHATPDAPSSVVGFIGLAGVFIDTADGKTINVIKVWFDGTSGTGGGISKFFAQMDEEKRYNLPVSKSTGKPGHSASLFADDADPASGAYIFLNGKWYRVGGTSSAAPSTAAKLKKMQSELRNPIKNVIAFAYAHFGDGICRQVTEAGSNDDYDAKPTDRINVPVGGGVIAYSGWMKVARSVQDGIAA